MGPNANLVKMETTFVGFRALQGPREIGEGLALAVTYRLAHWTAGEGQTRVVKMIASGEGTWVMDMPVQLTVGAKASSRYYRDDWTGEVESDDREAVAATYENYRIRYSESGEVTVARAEGIQPLEHYYDWSSRLARAQRDAHTDQQIAEVLSRPVPHLDNVPTEGYADIRGRSYPAGDFWRRLAVEQDGDRLTLAYTEGWPCPSNHDRAETRRREVVAYWYRGNWSKYRQFAKNDLGGIPALEAYLSR